MTNIVHRWTSGYYPFFPSKDGLFDQPELVVDFLKSIKAVNESLLTATLNYNGAEMPIGALLDLGIKDANVSFDVVQSLLDHCFKTESLFKPILIVDQVNALFCPTEYYDEKLKKYEIERFRLLAYLKGFLNNSEKVYHLIISRTQHQ